MAARNPKLTPQFLWLRGMLGTRFYVCKPNDPEAKGLTERNNGFFETSFLPGRRFTGPADFNAQLAGFLDRANARKRRRVSPPVPAMVRGERWPGPGLRQQ